MKVSVVDCSSFDRPCELGMAMVTAHQKSQSAVGLDMISADRHARAVSVAT